MRETWFCFQRVTKELGVSIRKMGFKDTHKDPPWVHTSYDGRKFLKSNEIVRLDRFKEQIEKLEKLSRRGHKVKE